MVTISKCNKIKQIIYMTPYELHPQWVIVGGWQMTVADASGDIIHWFIGNLGVF